MRRAATVSSAALGLLLAGCADPTVRAGRLDNGVRYWGAWEDDEVAYLVLLGEVPAGAEVEVHTGQDLAPRPAGVSVSGRGLFEDGAAVDTSGARRLFVLKPDGLEPVPLSEAELALLRWSVIGHLGQTGLWDRLRAAQRLR